MTKTIKLDKKGGFKLKELADMMDVSLADTYEFIDLGAGKVMLKLYDKKGTEILPYGFDAKPKRAVDEMRNQDITIPWDVNRFLDLDGKLPVNGADAALSKGGDYGSLEDMRKTVDWLANQFGGKVTWETKNGQ